MKILVAYECSSIVANEFQKLGHDVFTCDIKKSKFKNHIQNTIKSIDLTIFDFIIAFPPCTYVSYASGRYWRQPGRELLRLYWERNFIWLYNLPNKYICIENPRGSLLKLVKPSQRIEPYYFGHNYTKSTYLWLKNLPPLLHTPVDTLFEKQTHVKPVKSLVYSSKGSTMRSKFHINVAKAMAEQWTNYFLTL